MIHIDKNGNVIGSFDAPQGHGMAVDSKGFVYLGNDGRTRSANTIRRPANWSARCLARLRAQPGGGGGDAPATSAHVPGHGSAGQLRDFSRRPAGARSPILRLRRLGRRR